MDQRRDAAGVGGISHNQGVTDTRNLDALRDLARRGASAGAFEINETDIVDEVVSGLGEAIRLIETLQVAIDQAPHDHWCTAGLVDGQPCTCWKAEVRG